MEHLSSAMEHQEQDQQVQWRRDELAVNYDNVATLYRDGRTDH